MNNKDMDMSVKFISKTWHQIAQYKGSCFIYNGTIFMLVDFVSTNFNF